jgi:hypothetical protein
MKVSVAQIFPNNKKETKNKETKEHHWQHFKNEFIKKVW